MEFLTPLAGYLALFAVPIIIFYILKVRLRQQPISTILFWQQVFEERRSRSIWRKLRHLLSLLINLAFLTFLVLAVLNPVFTSQKKESRTVIIIDNSASMNAIETSGGLTRLDLVRSELLRYLSGTEVNMQTAMITAGGEPQVLVGFTNHLGTLRKKTDEIQPTDFPTKLGKAIELAEHLISGDENSRILVYTDGCSSEIEPYLDSEKIRFASIGRKLDNVAITQFQPRRSIGDAIGYEILLEAVNYSENPVSCRLEIDLNDNPIDIIPLTLEPNLPHVQMIRSTTESGGILKATLDHADAFMLDNTALAILPERTIQKILFYGESDFFLGHVLQSQQNVELSVIDECPQIVPEDTVLIIHRTVPETIPRGNVMVIDPQNDSDHCTVGKTLESPIVVNEEKDSPLMKFVHLNNVLMPGAKQLSPKEEDTDSGENVPSMTVLASTPEESPIFLLWDSPENKVLFLTAELKRGDLALRTAFPIMISNALNYFRGSGGELERAFATSEPVILPVSNSEKTVVLRGPDETEQEYPVQEGTVFLGTLPKCGIWTLLPHDEQAPPLKQIACNLGNAAESDLGAMPEAFHKTLGTMSVSYAGSRPIWFWLAVIALIFSIAEWYLYQRRWID